MFEPRQHSRKFSTDRFICETISHQQTRQVEIYHNSSAMDVEEQTSYERLISGEIFANSPSQNCVSNAFAPTSNPYLTDIQQLTGSSKVVEHHKSHPKKVIPSEPEKILDAPDLKDDYYLNLLDWSSRGQIAIGLSEKVYLYSSERISLLTEREEDDYVCSLSFDPQGLHLAVGLTNGKTEIYDVNKQVRVRSLKGHSNRVSSSAFTYGMLFTGSRDTKIIGHDYRAHHNVAMKLEGHRGEVCGLKQDPCGLASGSNDNSAVIWDVTAAKMRHQLKAHKAAVKALAWCPWQRNLLATGGGSSDKTMRFWNIESGKLINTVNTESQVCSLVWNKNDKQILSSHGFSDNQLCLWKYPDCTKVTELYGHTQRVLHMNVSPDNETVCTASTDETLRFWKVFQSGSSSRNEDEIFDKLNPKKFDGLR